MTETNVPNEVAWKHRELMLKVARRPSYCCCCVCLPKDDRRRARRVFRLTRRVMRNWRREEEARLDSNEQREMPLR
jgi:hypothetical protein